MTTTTIEWRRHNAAAGETGGLDVTVDGFMVRFDNCIVTDTLACQACGAAVADWRHTTNEEGQTVNAPKVNLERHVTFHASLGF